MTDRTTTKRPTFEVKVSCARCGYSERHIRGRGESYDGLKCPNCDSDMTDEGEAQEDQ